MSESISISQPLISVIIPCYNHGRYLSAAIESVLSQSYPNKEIIVIDDGSTDDTRGVTEGFKDVKYVYVENKGLGAARNSGIGFSRGELLVFLDADDWLLPHALQTNFEFTQRNPDAAFVSGAHIKVIESRNVVEEKVTVVEQDHYTRLLEGNFIAMHATVMYKRWVFDTYRYDESLPAFEDYDLYLKIARRYRIVHHQSLIAAYRIHNLNMSNNMPLMLSYAIKVLGRQRSELKNEREKRSYKVGVKYWKDYYSGGLYRSLILEPWTSIKERKNELRMLFANNVWLYFKLLLKKLINAG